MTYRYTQYLSTSYSQVLGYDVEGDETMYHDSFLWSDDYKLFKSYEYIR